MAEASDKLNIFLENLSDAGCDQEMIDECITLANQKNLIKMIKILQQYRTSLLESLHKSQKQIDCLDFFIYKIKKNKTGGI